MTSQPIARIGDKTTGHGPYLPRASTGGSGDVFVNNIGVNRVGDTWAPHNGVPTGQHSGETGITDSGSATVFVNNKPLARIGDNVDGADQIAGGSSDTFAG